MDLYRVYILQSERHNRFYTGMSSNVLERLTRHNEGGNKSTKNGAPWLLVWQSETLDKSSALKLERNIKKRGAGRFILDQNV